VGSSAVATTGQRWMSAAGSAVKVGTPFWMSGLVGKSTADFTINGSFNDVYIRSDRRSKRQIRKIERALDKVEQIEGVLYEIQVY
ncbi:tail fiber domain-containing protein, partial [Enterobacter hormaechei]|uniref:tail fiber domain-containing protein n=1 Tax=Enterobacter hormaechei TaxID=158836 RepID=UPI0025A01776